jgi:glucose-6-phosphate 1-dehydrogenase
VKRPGEEMRGEAAELVARHEARRDKPPYQRLLHDALCGDPTLFTRDDCVEAAWRVIEPVLRAPGRVVEYKCGSWGPEAAATVMKSATGWRNPVAEQPAGSVAPPPELEQEPA